MGDSGALLFLVSDGALASVFLALTGVVFLAGLFALTGVLLRVLAGVALFLLCAAGILLAGVTSAGALLAGTGVGLDFLTAEADGILANSLFFEKDNEKTVSSSDALPS